MFCIIKCPICKKIFIKEIRSKKTLERSIRCKFCNKTFIILSKKYGNSIIKCFEDSKSAREYLKSITNNLISKKD
ncbi:MAG: hypothetical protein QW038_02360 [Nanopusillaceae archaeon]